MIKFLTFQSFLTPTVLIIIYYLGAFVMPVASWMMLKWIEKSYLSSLKENIHRVTTHNQRIVVFILFMIFFLCMELCWRMMFEFFIAYFDMHDVLMRMGQSISNLH